MTDQPKGYAELRSDVMFLADQINQERLKLLLMIGDLNKVVTELVQFSEKILVKALDEYDNRGVLRPEFKTNAQAVADHTAPSARSCSICGEPGHRKTTCPKADVALKEKKEKAAEKDTKREREAALPEWEAGLLSVPEARAQGEELSGGVMPAISELNEYFRQAHLVVTKTTIKTERGETIVRWKLENEQNQAPFYIPHESLLDSIVYLLQKAR